MIFLLIFVLNLKNPNQANEEFLKSTAAHELYEQLNGKFKSLATSSSSRNSPSSSSTHESNYETPKSLSPSTSSHDELVGHHNSMSHSSSLPELQQQVSKLEEKVILETKRRKSLENAVKRLTEENRRLQDESQAAVQQLKRFTEWFFGTMDRQS